MHLRMNKMPIEKLVNESDSIIIENFVIKMCCYKCKETQFTLFRIKENGKKIEPAKYICEICRGKDMD